MARISTSVTVKVFLALRFILSDFFFFAAIVNDIISFSTSSLLMYNKSGIIFACLILCPATLLNLLLSSNGLLVESLSFSISRIALWGMVGFLPLLRTSLYFFLLLNCFTYNFQYHIEHEQVRLNFLGGFPPFTMMLTASLSCNNLYVKGCSMYVCGGCK